jgi:hypothetical protein
MTSLSVVLLGFVIFLAVSAQGPDRDLEFSRVVPTTLTADQLDRALVATINWPDWFFSTRLAEVLDGIGRPYPMTDQLIQTGSEIRLTIDPRKGRWKQYELRVKVIEYIPQSKLRLQLLSDSKGRLTRLFSSLEWEVDILPPTAGHSGSLLRSSTRAHTQHWRARMFAAFAERILLNQATYPDVIKLAELRQPKEPNPFFPTQR